MRNNYNYYPNNYNQMEYDVFLNQIGLNNSNTVSSNKYNTNNNNMLYGPYEGYIKGNLFKNLYEGYKNYEPAKILPKSEQEEALLNLNQIQFAMHEANLYLDVYPTDNKMMQEFNKFKSNYNNMLREYQNKYGALNINSDSINQIPFSWEEEVWPWDRRSL